MCNARVGSLCRCSVFYLTAAVARYMLVLGKMTFGFFRFAWQ